MADDVAAEPCVALALHALDGAARAVSLANAAACVLERERLYAALPAVAGVRQVYPSRANFLLARFERTQAAFDALLAAGVVVRDMRAAPQLADALRISLGTAEQNARVLDTLTRADADARAA